MYIYIIYITKRNSRESLMIVDKTPQWLLTLYLLSKATDPLRKAKVLILPPEHLLLGG